MTLFGLKLTTNIKMTRRWVISLIRLRTFESHARLPPHWQQVTTLQLWLLAHLQQPHDFDGDLSFFDLRAYLHKPTLQKSRALHLAAPSHVAWEPGRSQWMES